MCGVNRLCPSRSDTKLNQFDAEVLAQSLSGRCYDLASEIGPSFTTAVAYVTRQHSNSLMTWGVASMQCSA